MKHLLATLTCGLFLTAAHAQPAEKPSAYEHLKPLEWLIGDWVGDFTLPYDSPPFKKGDTVEYHGSARWIMNRNYIVWDFSLVKDGRRIPDSHEVIGWDPAHKRLEHRFYSPFGTGTGEWPEVGKKAKLTWSQGQVRATSVLEEVDANTHTWQVKGFQEGDQKPTDWPVVTFKRKTGVPAGDLWKACRDKVFTGTWAGDGELLNSSADGKVQKGDKFEARVAYTPVLGGAAVAGEMEFRVPSRSVSLKGRTLGSWDPGSRQVRMLTHWDNGAVEEVLLDRQQGDTFFGSFSGRFPNAPPERGPARMDFSDGGRSMVYRFLDGTVLSRWKRVDK